MTSSHSSANHRASRRVSSVALVGSSGGGAATLGHTDPTHLLSNIHQELCRIQAKNKEQATVETCYELKFALFVSVHGGKGLDSAADPDRVMATLYTVGCCGEKTSKQDDTTPDTKRSFTNNNDEQRESSLVRPMFTGTLRQVNNVCQDLDTRVIAPRIQANEVAALICVSCDPRGVNAASVSAAARAHIPVTGSGGTSLSAAVASYGIHLVGNAGGSVATTTYTRAVSYARALAVACGAQYSPFQSTWQYRDDQARSQRQETRFAQAERVRPHIGSVLNACLPAFVAVCVTSRALKLLLPHSGQHVSSLQELLFYLQSFALPTVCSVVSATSYAPEHGSTALIAAAVAASACKDSILGGLLAGWFVSWIVGRALFTCIRFNIPATMSNILVAGGVGASTAVALSASGVGAFLIAVTDFIRFIIRSQFPTGVGFCFGCLFCYGSKVGWYHAIILPLILIEMERGDASLLGAVDELTLVLVSAGICLANMFFPVKRAISTTSPSNSLDGDITISERGLWTNLLCGDFIEVAYPYMERSLYTNVVAYLASGFATEILFMGESQRVLSSAYLPVFASVWLAEDWRRMGVACVVAMSTSFVGGALGNWVLRTKERD